MITDEQLLPLTYWVGVTVFVLIVIYMYVTSSIEVNKSPEADNVTSHPQERSRHKKRH